MKKLSLLVAVVLAFALLLGFGVKGAQADTILFPYLSTQAGVFSFVTLVNDGLAEYSTVNGYHFVYGYKAFPVVNTDGCTHADGNVFTTPADMMTFEVAGKVLDGTSTVLFEGGTTPPVTSTAYTLTGGAALNQIAFLIVENNGSIVEVADTVARLFGWAEVIDTAGNLTLAYSTHNFLNDISLASFANLGATFHAWSWYPAAFVTTSWHVLPLGTSAAMSPVAGGGIRASLQAWDGGIFGAYDRDEAFHSGTREPVLRCFGIINRAQLLPDVPFANTANGGWAYVGPHSAGTVTVGGVAYPAIGNHLVHKVQAATAAAGVGTRQGINREPAFTPAYTP